VDRARADIVRRAVKLIGPDEHLRAKCKTAVIVALTMTGGSAKEMERYSQRRGKLGKRAVARLHKLLRDVRSALWVQDNPNPAKMRLKLMSEAGDVWEETTAAALPVIELHPDLPIELRELRHIISPDDLARAIELVNEVRRKTGGRRYPYKAMKKLAAAREAHNMLQQFDRKISITKDSVFCKLTALLYGEPDANLQWTCRKLLEDKKLRS
jgi:hypothetical protein